MANSTSIQILVDGPRNVVAKFEGILDTSDLGSTVVLDPATLSAIGANGEKATRLGIKKITCNIEPTLAVNLFWDATTPVRIQTLTGDNELEYCDVGYLKSSAGTWDASGAFTPNAGHTGKITATTQGWAASGVLSFSVLLECVKQ